MEHAKTIAMARDLLGDGRAEDVRQMIDPLLERVDAPAASTGQLLLHALRAQIEVVHRDHPERTLNLLPPLPEIDDLCTCVRAEVALWRGWAHARRSTSPPHSMRALDRLQHAEELFDSIHDPRGRGWALLGQVQAYLHLDAYTLLRRPLSEAASLSTTLDDQQLDRWVHELSVSARRADGQYDHAHDHLASLQSLTKTENNRFLRGHTTAHEAALQLDLGAAPDTVVETADAAETLLHQADTQTRSALLTAYCAHIEGLFRLGRWADARSVLDEAHDALSDVAGNRVRLQTLRARLALRQNDIDRADHLLSAMIESADQLPHGVHRSHVSALRGTIRAHQRRLGTAYTWLQRAHRNACETGHRGRQLRTLLTMAQVAAHQSDVETARAHLDDADAYADCFGVLPLALHRFAAEGTVALAAHEPDRAATAYRHALAAATMMGDRPRRAVLHHTLTALDDESPTALLNRQPVSLLDGPTPTADESPSTAPPSAKSPSLFSVSADPSDDAPLSSLGPLLSRASLSMPVVAHTWLHTAARLFPNRWLGVYRCPTDGAATLLAEHGQRPDAVSASPDDETDRDAVSWIELRSSWIELGSSRPTLALGIEQPSDQDDPEADAAYQRLRTVQPLFRLALERARSPAPTRPSAAPASPAGLVTESDAMQAVMQHLDAASTSAHPVLITGESGTGKCLLGRTVHARSRRPDGPLQHVACNTMQRDPLSERLFGHVEADGTLTPGAVQKADGGTLLLEDVDALPTSAQDTLLHVLETGTVVPPNGTTPTPVDVRVVATADGDLEQAVRNDQFRPALHQRLSTLALRMPPLRERRADIPLLVRHFLKTLRSDHLKAAPRASVTQPAMEALLRYDWPGNVRQLRNEVERALVYVENEPAQTIDRDVLSDRVVEEARSHDEAPSPDAPDAILRPDQTLNDVLSRTETTVIERVLEACDGQVTASAEVLGLSRQGLYKKMKRLGIDASDFQPDTEPAAASS